MQYNYLKYMETEKMDKTRVLHSLRSKGDKEDM